MPRKQTPDRNGKIEKRSIKSQSDEVAKSLGDTLKGQTATEKKQLQHSGSPTTRKRAVDTEAWVERNIDELIGVFHLSALELSREEARVVAQRLVEVLRGESSTLDMDTIRRRFARHSQHIRQLIAQVILEIRDELSQSQLEFIANNVGEAILGHAARLYREALRCKREDVIEMLRVAWRTYWVSKRYTILPVECPNCKFNSLMPDLGCIVCGASVTEEELKRYLGFERLLQDFVKQYSEDEVKKAIVFGYVYLSSVGLKPPTRERDKLDIEVLLSSKEREYLRSLLGNRGT